MADDAAPEEVQMKNESETATSEVPTPVAPEDVQMKLESDSENGGSKRSMEDDDIAEEKEEKRVKVSDVEEKPIEQEKTEEGGKSGPATIGPKKFDSSVEMFDYFYKLLHTWSPNINLNKYEHVVLLELLKQGHLEAERKIGKGVKAFQVRYHPEFKSRCFFLVREDGSVDDFSFRKCVDHIHPLPENMQVKHDVNKALRGKGRGRGRGRGGRGRGGK